MKVLSLKQPFAELVVSGRKKIELRKWNTKFRGVFLIHASKVPDKGAMEEFNFDDLPLGCIVGKVELFNVKKYECEKDFLKDRDLHLASIDWENYGFVLKNAVRVENVFCNGKLGFWNFENGVHN